MTDERHEKGLAMLRQMHGQPAIDLLDRLAETSPDLVGIIINHAFGELYARPGLDIRSRQIATIAALVALGNAEPQLSSHVKAGLHIGLSKEEIRELILQLSAYAGIPAAMNAMRVAEEVFADSDRAGS